MAPIILISATGLVYRNPMPHLRSHHAFFPTVVELQSGALVAAFDAGSAFEAVDVRSYCSRSLDGGMTWSAPALIFQPDERQHLTSTTCRIGKTGPSELLGWACLFDRTRSDEGLCNPKTDGFCHTGFLTLRSHDEGQTWSQPQAVQLPTDWRHFETCAAGFAVGGERLLLATSPWPAWDGAVSPWGHDGLAFASDNLGHTWTEVIQTFRNGAEPVTAYEQSFTQLTDGRVLAVCWTFDLERKQSRRNRIAFSADGKKFGDPQATPLTGETCRVLALPGNRVLAVYRRTDRPGLWAQIASIDGERWTPLADSPLWTGGPAYGADADTDSRMAQMSTLRFGCPGVVQLQSGEIFVVFWCFEDCVSVIRWLRLELAGL